MKTTHTKYYNRDTSEFDNVEFKATHVLGDKIYIIEDGEIASYFVARISHVLTPRLAQPGPGEYFDENCVVETIGIHRRNDKRGCEELVFLSPDEVYDTPEAAADAIRENALKHFNPKSYV